MLIAVTLLLTVEIVLRIYQYIHPELFMPDSTYMSYRGKPYMEELNGFHLNSKGYKDGEFSSKKPGTFRIIAIGDSQVFGAVPYRDCWLTILEKKMINNHPDVEILNMGIPAAGPVDYLSLLINEGIDLKPDIVLIMLYLGDDFYNGGKRYQWYSHSAAATLLNGVIMNRCPPRGRMFATGFYSEARPLRTEKAYVEMMATYNGDMFIKNNRRFIRDFRSVINLMERMKSICDSRRIGLAAVLCPSDVQIYPDLRLKVLKKMNVPESRYDIQLPDRMMKDELLKLDIPSIDLLEYFSRKYAEGQKHFNQGNDPHWNRYGNKFAADLLLPWLTGIIDFRKRR